MAGHSQSAAVLAAASRFVSARSSAPSPRSGATGCTSPLRSRHGVGHYVWTTQTPPLPKSMSVTRWRPHRLPASPIRRELYQARRSPSRPLAGYSPNLAWPSRGQPTTSCPRPSSLRQSPPRERLVPRGSQLPPFISSTSLPTRTLRTAAGDIVLRYIVSGLEVFGRLRWSRAHRPQAAALASH